MGGKNLISGGNLGCFLEKNEPCIFYTTALYFYKQKYNSTVGAMEKYRAKVSSKGWIVIPASLRKRFNITPGVIVEVREKNGKITITPPRHDLINRLYGKWADNESLIDALLDSRAKELDREEKKIRTG